MGFRFLKYYYIIVIIMCNWFLMVEKSEAS